MALEEIIFPSNIRNIRLAKGMKMTELARRSGLSLSAVSKIEKGVRRLNQKQLLNICNILDCTLSDVFIKESDEIANMWQDEIKRRMIDNESGGLKIFGAGLRKIRTRAGKTIASAAKDAKMTLSVYHKIEVGQRDVYENEIEPLAKSFKMTVDKMFDEIADMYKSGILGKQIAKVKERVISVMVPGNSQNIDGGMYGAKLYDSARSRLAPVYGKPLGRAIEFTKSDKNMIELPANLDGHIGIYAVRPNPKRTPMIPANALVFADSNATPKAGDMAVFIDADFAKMKQDMSAPAQIAIVDTDTRGKTFGKITGPDEKITFKTMHRVVMIVMG